MSIAEALAELKAILGQGVSPATVPKVREVLIRLKESDVGNSDNSSHFDRQLNGYHLSASGGSIFSASNADASLEV
jgi:hypothetical protein